MVIAYIRVSTEKQNTENQKFEIEKYCKVNGIVVEKWVEEKISGLKKMKERMLGGLLSKLKKDDLLIISELSRLGRNLMGIMKILHDCMENDIRVVAIKEGYVLGNNINSKVLAFAFGLSAEIERNLISQRTKEALARRKEEGVILGRPKGSKTKIHKLKDREEIIIMLVGKGKSFTYIAKRMSVHRTTISNYLKERKLSPRRN
ncbi:MAG: master DNA invertase Mpi family serine-type recombinase [Bacteroidia bacterium]|nr:master DNA invertase Mpi family serine-type recombinase [Bacteroidia bacterium]